ncbi:ParA family protein [Brevibacterium otitidis]|uniref:ParA family protein n=1 Tax=Brevibacterium otitidis TaxID=53364 RepID=A0ABV5WY82_9MICO|nr:hypothetical protein GCM10023233_13450 [Brevibacterium otitidis]
MNVLVLSVSSLKGGVGKTSVTLGLASAAYSRGIPTLVMDMDPQADASTGLDIPVRTEADIADVLAAPRKRILERAVVPSGWVGDQRGHIDVISGSPRAAEFDQPSLSMRYLRRLSQAIHKAGTGYRLVLIDCPPSLNGLTRAAWTASNRVLIVTEPGLFSVAAADRALRATDELRRRTASGLQPLGIVVNRARLQSREHSYRIEELREMFGPLILNPPVPERTVLQQAQGSARPIHSWPGKPAAELAAAFDKILDRALRSERIGRKNTSSAGASRPAAADASEASAAADRTQQAEPAANAQQYEPQQQDAQASEPDMSDGADATKDSVETVDAPSKQDSDAPTADNAADPAAAGEADSQAAADHEPAASGPEQPEAHDAPAEGSVTDEGEGTPADDAHPAAGAPPAAGAQEVPATKHKPETSERSRPAEPLKPTSAPTVGSPPSSAAAMPAADDRASAPEAASGSNDIGAATEAMPRVTDDASPAAESDPAEEQFLTRRQLRVMRAREKASKPKWFGR